MGKTKLEADRNTCTGRCSVATATADKLQLASPMWMCQPESRFRPMSGSITVCNIRGGKPSVAGMTIAFPCSWLLAASKIWRLNGKNLET